MVKNRLLFITYFCSYEEAVTMLTTTEILAPVYYIVGGSKPGQGAVITRDRTKTDNVISLNITKGEIYLVIYDRMIYLQCAKSFATSSC